MRIWSIGHGARPLDEFLELLSQNGIRAIADIRAFPGSRRHPHFGQDALAATLPEAGIAYVHADDLFV